MSSPLTQLNDKTARATEYIQQYQRDDLQQIASSDNGMFAVDMTTLADADPALYRFTQQKPKEAKSWWSDVVTNYAERCEDYAESDDVDVSECSIDEKIPSGTGVTYSNVPESAEISIGEPRTDRFGELVRVRGVVRNLSSPMTRVLRAAWECRNCGTLSYTPVRNDTVRKPHHCRACEEDGPFKRQSSHEEMVDYQEMYLQEEPSEATDSSNPRTLTVRIQGDDRIDSGLPGERVTVTGRLCQERDDDDAVLVDSHLVALEIESERRDFSDIEITKEDIDEFEAVAGRDDVLDFFADSLAPDIHGQMMPKQAIVLQLLGGVTKHEDSEIYSTVGGELHYAFIGDPGTGKSRLAEHARTIAPRAVKTVGKGASAPGMTASAVKRTVAGSQEWSLKAGSLVLADKGLITIDELDKMGEEVQQALNEALSDREVSVSKADIQDVTLKARTSALMVANPKYGRFDPYEPFTDQFGVDSSLLDRASLVVTFRDTPDEEHDGDVADTIIHTHWGDEDGGVGRDVLSKDFMRKYIAYAKREYDPTGTKEVRNTLQEFYRDQRANIDIEDGVHDVSIAPRALEGLIKLSEAHARLRLSNTVTMQDAEVAIRLFTAAMKRAGLGSDISVSQYTGRRGAPKRERQKEAIRYVVKEMGNDDGWVNRMTVVPQVASELGKDVEDVSDELEHVIDTMVQQGDLMSHGGGRVGLPE